MTLSGKLILVARTKPEHSLARKMVGTAWPVRDTGEDLPTYVSVPDRYLLEPEGFADYDRVAGLLFTEVDLKPIPNTQQY